MSYSDTLTAQAAFDRYEAVRSRMPVASFPARAQPVASLVEVAGHVDAFVLDAFGVLNVGATPIPGVVERMAQLRAMGKRLIVLTNAASDTRAAALAKYRTLGYDFAPEEVVASRDVCAARMGAYPVRRWGAVATDVDSFADLGAEVIRWTPESAAQVDGFLLLSSAAMDGSVGAALQAELMRAPRPLLVANPDIVAPRETGLSREPGAYAHGIADALGIEPVFFGKPFGNAYEDVLARLDGIPAHRCAMVGDTLHTDVLGGAAAGMRTVLVTDHGLFRGLDTAPFIERSGIVPDYICPSP